MRILDRYVARELLTPFVFGVAMFTAIFLGASVLPQVAKLFIQGGSMAEVFWIFLLSLPGVVVVTFPMAMLLATLLGIGRLSSELEIVAALASGVSLRRIALPVLATAMVVTVLDFGFQEKVVPQCAGSANRLIDGIRARTDVVSDRTLLIPVPDPNQGPPRLVVIASKLRLGPRRRKGQAEEGTLLNVTIVYLNKRSLPEMVIHAREAHYVPAQGRWRLEDARYYHLPVSEEAAGGEPEVRVMASLRIQENLIDLGKPPSSIQQSAARPEELTIPQLRLTIRNRMRNGMAPSEYEVHLHQRLAVPFAAIVFALIGAPLGLRRQRTGSSLGLGLSVLIIFLYYILWHYLGTLGKGGAMDPLAAAWIPNLIGLAAGGVLLQRAPK